jgi:hypothetical protein
LRHCERSEAIQKKQILDCFVAEFIIGPAKGRTRWLLAMTIFTASTIVILRSRALARRLEGWPQAPALVAHPSRLAEDGEHLGMTAVLVWLSANRARAGG